VINPGSHLGDAQNAIGWTNTYDTAHATAEEWLARMRSEGLADIELYAADVTEREGRWTFTFRHTVTGVKVELETHGIDDPDAYKRQFIFDPRVYWNGSSSANPSLEDFATPGYVMTFRAEVVRDEPA
jgi:hypothetical protein